MQVSYSDTALILTTTLFRAAMVSSTRGNRVINSLREKGKISPVKTPTGRELLTPTDGETVFNALARHE